MNGKMDFGRIKRSIVFFLGLILPTAAGLRVGRVSGSVVEGLAVGVGTLALIVLLRSDFGRGATPAGGDHETVGLLSGTGLGAILGIVTGIAVGNLAFFGIGAGAGLLTGLALASNTGARDRGTG
jgi:hypothetical protein